IWIVAPNLIAAAAPLLLFAACPLSMWLMMRGMSGGQQNAQTPAKPAADSTRTRDLPTLKGEHARLTAELEALESDVTRAKNEQAGSPNGSKNLSETRASHSEKASEDDVAP
ncbi:MAG: DUF2933 domain-containing protein, partial [Dehalococcoidia bacterium]